MAPLDPRLQPYLVTPADWPGSSPTTLAAVDFNGLLAPFSPCGYPFDDTATAGGRASITLAVPQVANRPSNSSLVYLNEDLAEYPTTTAAQQMAADFRKTGDSCRPDPQASGSKSYQDIPFLTVGGTSWQEALAPMPSVGEDRFAVRIAKSNGGYYLVLVRMGRHIAFLRAGDATLGDNTRQVLEPLVIAAAGHLPSG